MEEQKSSKEVKLGVAKNTKSSTLGTAQEQTKKLNYDELNQACMELSAQNQQMQNYIKQLHQQIQQMNMNLQTKRLDYLFKVVEAHTHYHVFKEDFVNNCIDEIQESLTIPEGTEESKKD